MSLLVDFYNLLHRWFFHLSPCCDAKLQEFSSQQVDCTECGKCYPTGW